MKEILMLLILILTMTSTTVLGYYIHISNDTTQPFTILLKNAAITQTANVLGLNVLFLEPTVNPKMMEVRSSVGNAVFGAGFPIASEDQAYVLTPDMQNGQLNGVYIKKRSNGDTRLILDQHKVPTNPSFASTNYIPVRR